MKKTILFSARTSIDRCLVMVEGRRCCCWLEGSSLVDCPSISYWLVEHSDDLD